MTRLRGLPHSLAGLCLAGCATFVDGLAAVSGHGGEIARNDAMQETAASAQVLREKTRPPPTAWEATLPNETADLIRFVGPDRVLVGTLEIGAYLGVPDHGPVRLYEASSGRLLWEAPRPSFKDGRYSLLAAAPAIVLMGGSDRAARVLALDPATGSLKWDHSISGPHRVATTDDVGHLIVAVGDGGERTLYSLDLATGATTWSLKLDAADFSLDAGTLFVLGRRLAALDVATGQVLWSVQHPILMDAGVAISVSAPGPVAWSDKALAVFDPKTGAERWTAAVQGGNVKLVSALDGMVLSVAGNKGAEEIQARDHRTGAVRWTKEVEGAVVSPLVQASGLVLYTLDGALVGIDSATGEKRFRTKIPSAFNGNPPSSTPYAQPDQLRLGSELVYVAREGAGIAAFKLPGGELAWHQSVPALNYSTTSRSMLIDAALVVFGKAPADHAAAPGLAAAGTPSVGLRNAQASYEQARRSYQQASDRQLTIGSPQARAEATAARGKVIAAGNLLQAQEKVSAAMDRMAAAGAVFSNVMALNEALANALRETAVQGAVTRLKIELEAALRMRLTSFQGGYYLQPFIFDGKGRGVMVVNLDTGERSDVVFAALNSPLTATGIDPQSFAIDPGQRRLVTVGVGLDASKHQEYVRWKWRMPRPSVLAYDVGGFAFAKVSSLAHRPPSEDQTFRILWEHVSVGDVGEARKLVAKGVDLDYVPRLKPPLLVAAARGDHPNVVQLLLENGADPGVRDLEGKTAVWWSRSPEVREMLHKARCGRVPECAPEDGLPALPPEWFAPLMKKLRARDRDGVRRIVAGGVDLNYVPTSDVTALRLAVSLGDEELVQLLLDHGADPTVAGPDRKSPLDAPSYLVKPSIRKKLEDARNRSAKQAP